MSARPALLRLARRDAGRNRRRTLLMLLLIALPIAGSALAATLFTTVRVTGDDQARAALGDADLALTADAGVDIDAAWPAARALLGPVSDVEPVAVRSRVLGSEAAQVPTAVWAAERHETTRAMLQLVAGDWPDRAGELLLTPAVAGDLGVRVGATVKVDGRPYVLVGIARDRLDLDRRMGVTTLDGAVPTTLFVDLDAGDSIDAATAAALEELGLRPALRSTAGASSSGEAVVGIVLLGGLAFAVVALVAAAAFAVIAEQRQHELAQLRAVGATPRQLRSAVTASGWVYGALGSLAGLLAALGSAFLVRGWLEPLLGRAITEVRVPWAALGAIVVVGVLTAVGAARAPARRAAAGATRTALTGSVAARAWERLPVARVVMGLTGITGTVVFATAGAPHTSLVAGALVTLALVVLAIVGAGGAGQVAVALVARLSATRMRPVVRIALRDLRRMPSRVAPIVTALVAVLALDVLVVGFVSAAAGSTGSPEAVRLGPQHLVIDGPTPALALADIATRLPVTHAATLRIVQPHCGDACRAQSASNSTRLDLAARGGQLPVVAIATDGLLADLDVDDDARTAAQQGQALAVVRPGGSLPWVPAVLAPHGVHEVPATFWPRDVPTLLVPPATMREQGLAPAREGSRLLVRLGRPVTDADIATATEIAARYQQRVQGAVPPPSIDAGRVRTIATVGAAVIGLMIALTGLALMRVAGGAADQTLRELGAPPRFSPRLAATRALVLCGLASGLALAIGVLALWAVTRASSSLAGRIASPTPITILVMLLLPIVVAGYEALPGRGSRPRMGRHG